MPVRLGRARECPLVPRDGLWGTSAPAELHWNEEENWDWKLLLPLEELLEFNEPD